MVGDWIEGFVVEHRDRHPSAGLPGLDTEEGRTLYEAWRAAFVHRGIHDPAVATEASKRLTAEPLRHSSQHFPRLVELALEIYRERSPGDTTGGTGDSSREAAALASRNCQHCSGDGLATLLRRSPLGPDCSRCGADLDPDGVCRECHPGVPQVPASVAAFCVCPYGQWIERTTREGSPEVWRRTPHLANALAGRSVWRPRMAEMEVRS